MRHSDKCSTEESSGSCGTPKGRLSEKVMLLLTFENISKTELDGVGERHSSRGESMGESVDMGCDMTCVGNSSWLGAASDWPRRMEPREDAAREKVRDQIMKGSLCILRFCREAGRI